MLASRRVSYIQTINIWFPSTATLPVLSSKLQECHRRRCNVRRFGPGLCRDWRRESTNQNRVLKAMCFLFLVEIWEGKFQDAFRLLFRFSFFVDCVSDFFLGNMGVYLSIHFLDDHFFGWLWWLSLGWLDSCSPKKTKHCVKLRWTPLPQHPCGTRHVAMVCSWHD